MEREKINLITDFLEKDKSILAVYLFGSQAREKVNKYSDVDIAVLFNSSVRKEEFAKKQLEFIAQLTGILNKEVDVIILNSAPLFLRYNIIRTGSRIYERPGRNEHIFEAMAILQYFDFLPIKQIIEKGILTRIKEA